MTEDNCVWGQVNGRWTDQSSSGDTQGYKVRGTTYRFGAQHEFAPEWFLGGSLAGGYTHSQSNGGSSGNGTTYDGSITLKHVKGPWQLAGSLAVSRGTFEANRNINFDGMNLNAKSRPDALLAGAKFRAGYEFSRGDWYLKPYGDVDVYYSKLSGFKEGGGTPYALRVRSADKTNVALTPMLELGRRVDLDAKTSLRTYAALGVSYRPDSSYTINSSFVNANASSGTFKDRLKSPEVLGKIDLGLQLYRAGGFEAKAGYTVDVGSHYNSQTATARFAYHF
jgi:outer membrane autotransporter protein